MEPTVILVWKLWTVYARMFVVTAILSSVIKIRGLFKSTKWRHFENVKLKLSQPGMELNDPENVSATWVKHLYELVDKLNDTETQMTGMKLKDAIKLNQVPLIKQESYPQEDTLPEDGLYHYLLHTGEEHDDQCKRAMDRIWSKKITDRKKLWKTLVIV